MSRVSPNDKVLKDLKQLRAEAIGHPEKFQDDAVERIDKAIAFVQSDRVKK